MKKFLCLVLGVVTALTFSSCAPTRVETQEQKEMKQRIKEEMAELDEILARGRAQETTEETTEN